MITHAYVLQSDGNKTNIAVTFTDDQTNNAVLVAETTIIGNEQQAIAYVPIFIQDMERNFPHIKNPEPEPEVPPKEGEMI